MTLDSVALTQKLLAFKTVNPPGNERDCARYLGELLEDAGYSVGYFEFADRRTTLIASLAGAGERLPICFTGHLDTVPLGPTIWSKDAFAGEIDGDRLFGRGSSDMKSGMAAITLMALQMARLSGRKAGLTVIFTAGEETTCEGALHIASLPGLLGDAGAIVAGEPTACAPWIAHKGCVRYRIKAKGVAAHASMPEKGVNAIYKAADAIQKLERFEFDFPPHALLGCPTLAVTTMSAGTAVNMIPEEASFCVDIRTLPGQTEEAVGQVLQTALGPEFEMQKLNSAASVGSDKDNEWIQSVFDVSGRLSGKRPEPAGAAYFTDCSVLTPAYKNPPTVILGPGEPDLAHKTDEFCYLEKIELAVEIYSEIAKMWCGI
jgi:succinyl-diaminopimelate desuccinylase